MSSLTSIITGTFTSDGTAYNLSLPSGYVKIELVNLTDLGSTAASTPVMTAYGTSSMSAGSAVYATKTNGAATIAIATTTASGGFTFISDSAAQSFSPLTISTGISQANPAVVTLASTSGLAAGDIVRVYGTTGMLQVAGWDFTIASVVANTSFTLAYLDSSGFAAAATAGTVRKLSPARFLPRVRLITSITKASSAVITLSTTHQYAAGQVVTVYVPSQFGMLEMDGLSGTITAVNTTTNTITLNIDSSSFTTFAFPTSAVAAAGVNFPIVVPYGESVSSAYASLTNDAVYNNSFRGVQIGTSVQTTGKVYQYIAYQGQSV
jgi:hypothetical protein